MSDAMWSLYEAYVDDMQMRRPFTPVADALDAIGGLALPPPPPMANPGQIGPTTISAGETRIGPLVGVRVESTAASDRHELTFDVVVRREWTGETQANVFVRSAGWEQEP